MFSETMRRIECKGRQHAQVAKERNSVGRVRVLPVFLPVCLRA